MTDPAWLLAVLLLMAGCRSYPLSEVPIVGGSEEARSIVEDELASFSEAIQPEEVELSKIVFGTMRGQYEENSGWYRVPARHIQLDEAVPVEDISRVLRHELCHALDYQTGITKGPHEVLDAYAERIYDPEIGGKHWEKGARDRRGEALAIFCEVGPTIADAVATPCPGESPLLSELGSFALAEIWSGVPEGPIPLPEGPPVSFSPGGEPFVDFALQPTERPDLLLLTTFDPEHVKKTYELDLRSGEQISLSPDPFTVSEVVEEVPPAYAFERLTPFAAAGGADGALVAGVFDIPAFQIPRSGYPRERLLWSGGGDWAALPICLPGSWAEHDTDPMLWWIFAAQDQVWYAEGDGQKVWWSPVTDQGQ